MQAVMNKLSNMTPLLMDQTLSDSLFDSQLMWSRDHTVKDRLEYPRMRKFLTQYNYQQYFEEILNNIFGPLFDVVRRVKGIEKWSVKDISRWLTTLTFLEPETRSVVETLEYQLIDGNAFMFLQETDWTKFGLRKKHFILLSCIRKGWKNDWGEAVPRIVRKNDETIYKPLIPENYGRLIVIGAKESRLSPENGTWQPLGDYNDSFVLKKRPTGNSLKFIASENFHQQESYYETDPCYDMFQIGRSEAEGANDFTVHGNVHMRKNNYEKFSSPVSRLSCRILCNRETKQVFLFASGFLNQQIFVGENYLKLTVQSDEWKGQYDALTTFGVKLWNPNIREWSEISVQGNCYSIRETKTHAGVLLSSPFTNEIVDGSIIDLFGVKLLYQDPLTSKYRSHINPRRWIQELNLLKPQCPVMMQTLSFSYMDSKERSYRHRQAIIEKGIGYIPLGVFPTPPSDHSDLDEGSSSLKTFVFPACGHVHGFHQSLIGKPCPLCRTSSCFVPLAFEFDSPLCIKKPTHVFNPCGHAVDIDTAKTFSSIPTFVYDQDGDIIDQKSVCPICSTELNSFGENGGPFNRLMLQTESGLSWDDGSDNQTFPIDKYEYSEDEIILDLFNSANNQDVTHSELKILKLL